MAVRKLPMRMAVCRLPSLVGLLGWSLFAAVLAVHFPQSTSGEMAKPQAEGAVEKGAAGPRAAGPRVDNDDRPRRVGRLIRVPTPITDKVDARVRRAVENAISQAKQQGEWPVLILEIDQTAPTEFGQALDLAKFLSSDRLNGATTVAYLPKTITGHHVLVAMACDEIIMHVDAYIGKAGEQEPVIEASVRNAYVEIANRHKTIPADLALGMLDPALEVYLVETAVSREFVLSSRLEEVRKQKAFQSSEVIKKAGSAGFFSATQGREWGFVSYLANDQGDVAKALGLDSESMDEDLAMDGEWRPVLIRIKDPIDATKIGQAKSMLQKQIDEDANFFCIWIESPGGSPTDSMELANFLADLDPARRRTVAYIGKEARADAAFIALACDHIVMTPEAILGGTGARVIEGQEAELAAITLKGIAKKKFRSAALAEALVNPNLQVFRYVRQKDGLKAYYTEAEHAALEDSKDWQREAEVTTRGTPLRVNGEKAEQLGLARHVVQDFAEFKAVYGLQGNLRLVEPSWADVVIDALNTPSLGFILLLLGAASLYAEFQSPGVGLGALVAALCFLLYFWSHFLGGTAGWLEVLLFLAGMVCIALEVFVFPGFGIFGLGGGLMVLCSLVLASQTFVLPRNDYQIEQLRNTLLMLGGAAVGTMVAAALIHKFLPHTPMFNRMLLAPPSGEELSSIARREALAEWAHLLGRQGTTITPLAPSGKARFGEQLVDVIADGEFIERGQSVVVVETRGNRVLVKSLA